MGSAKSRESGKDEAIYMEHDFECEFNVAFDAQDEKSANYIRQKMDAFAGHKDSQETKNRSEHEITSSQLWLQNIYIFFLA